MYADSGRMTSVLVEGPGEDRSWSGSKSTKLKYSRLMILCTSFCGRPGVPGKLASGFETMPGAVGSLGVMVMLPEEAVRVGVSVVSGRLEVMEGRRRGPVGGDENAGKPSADSRGGGGGNVSEDVPGITRSMTVVPIMLAVCLVA